MEEFECFKESHFYPGANPPAFLKSLKEKNKIEKQKLEDNENKEEIDTKNFENNLANNNKNDLDLSFSFRPANSGLNIYNNNYSFNNSRLNLNSELSNLNLNNDNSDYFTFRKLNSDISNSNNNNNESQNLRASNSELLGIKPNISGIYKKCNNFENLSLKPGNSSICKIKKSNELTTSNMAEEKLSKIPDNEDYKYFYDKDEYTVRKQFWEIMFKDWIEQQKEKEEKEGKEKKIKVREPKKRIKKMIFKFDGNKISPDEAIKNSSKIFGRKMDITYVRKMLSKKMK
jgi:hypothetical protein